MAADPAGIRAFQRLSEAITTSGRLREADLDTLAASGVGHVINLALDDHPEALPDEARELARRGIGYAHIPVPFDAPGEDQFAAFVAALDAAGGQRVHVHCIMNWRVSAFFYRLHRERAAMPEAAARALLERQWAPDRHDHPAAPAWAKFIGIAKA